MNDDDIEGVARQSEIVDIAMAYAAILKTGAVEARAGKRQHVQRKIDPEPALDVMAEQF